MASLLCHLHFWTIQPLSPALTSESGSHIAVHSYQPKGQVTKVDTEYCRRQWSEGRGITWHLSNQKPNKLRDSLREVEELLSYQRIVCLQWKTLRHFVLVLQNGTLLVFTVAKHSGDIEGILIDRSLIPKLQGQTIDRALLLNGSIVILPSEQNHVLYLTPPPRRASGDGPTVLTLSHDKLRKRIEKLATLDLKLFELEVKGMPDHQIDRHVLCNPQQDLLVIWWRDIQENGIQWSGMAAGEHTNMLLIKLKSNGKLELLTKLETTCQPITVFFGRSQGNVLYVFGQLLDAEEWTYELSLVDCSDRKGIRQSSCSTVEASLSCEAQVKICSPNKDDSLLAVGCESGLIMIFDVKRDHVKKTKAFFSSITHISWHPAGGVVFVCGSRGEIQCLDCALNSLSFLLPSELNIASIPLLELGSHCMVPVQLECTGWASVSREGEGHSGCYDNFVMIFSQGPIVLLRIELGIHSKGRLTVSELMTEYLRHKQLKQGVELLLSLNWELHPQDCLNCLTIYMDHLLSLPLTPTNEELLESALGSFFAGGFSQSVVDEFYGAVYLMARRFFFQLLRSHHFEKALRLAVDLSCKDLFMELYYTALEKEEMSLAELSLKKAELLRKEKNRKSIESTDSVPTSLEVRKVEVITDEDRVIHNPAVATSPERERINILESSVDSATDYNIVLRSSSESSTSSQSKTKRPIGNSWATATATHDPVNVINFGYFAT